MPLGDDDLLVLDLRGHIGAVTSASFDQTGARLASTGADGRVRVWALDRNELVAIAQERVTRLLTAEERSTDLRVADDPLCSAE